MGAFFGIPNRTLRRGYCHESQAELLRAPQPRPRKTLPGSRRRAPDAALSIRQHAAIYSKWTVDYYKLRVILCNVEISQYATQSRVSVSLLVLRYSLMFVFCVFALVLAFGFHVYDNYLRKNRV